MAAGRIWTPGEARELLAHGADMVALGEAAIFNPEWPHLAGQSDWAPIRPPFTADQFGKVAVTSPFVDYLAEGWPELVNAIARAEHSLLVADPA